MTRRSFCNTTKNIQVQDDAWDFLLAENLLASQDSLFSMELPSLLVALLLYQAFYISTQNNSVTAIDNIFIKVSKFDDYIISPLVNGMSDHDAQVIMINDINIKILNNTPHYIRNIDKDGIADFKIKLSLETWDNVFDDNDVNSTYNSFLNTYLRVFYSSFPLKKLIT